jgi:hypothetical protein
MGVRLTRRMLLLLGAASLAVPGRAAEAQDDLTAAVVAAREAWLAHDIPLLLEASDTVRLHLPEIAQALSVRPAQAVRLLQAYLKTAEEHAFTLREIRHMGQGHAYAEMERLYVVKGTSEERTETVYIGFRRVGDVWRLREVRVTP